nr:putative ribonuclease H-like domain-containing protein [Tanacetum cinerariifolium]
MVGPVEQPYEPTIVEERLDRKNEIKSRGTLLMALPNKDQLKFHSYQDAKLLMKAIEKRLQKLISQLEIQGEVIEQEDINLNLLRSLPSEWKTHALIWRNKAEIETISLDDLEDLEQIDLDGLEEMDLKSTVGCFNCHKNGHFAREFRASNNQENRGKEYGRKITPVENPIKNALIAQDGIGGQVSDKVKTGLGYKAASPAKESFVKSSKMLKNQENVKSISDKGYHAVPPPYTGNYIPPKPDLMFINEQVESESMDIVSTVSSSAIKTVESKVEFVDVKNKGVCSTIETKPVRKKNLVLQSMRIGFLMIKKEYMEKGVIDSGCSRHMTRNKWYLTEYEDYDCGFVSIRDGKGRISVKGKIKPGTLYFDDVYFFKELKYNLFSVSQICDKKNNVFFTDTECLVLSSNFKLLDETQVLLRVPRKDNIYTIDLKSVVPTIGFTCLFAKATTNESNLWYRRLGHINYKTMNKLVRRILLRGLPSKIFENNHGCVSCQKGKQHKASYKAKLVNSISKPLDMLHMDLFGPINVKSLMRKSYCLVITNDFSRFSWVFFLTTKDETNGILKTFITGIENQLVYKVKVLRYHNGTEFKNGVMNQFYDMKGIKREFNVARTPQHNGVAERKNKTLIAAVRTMALVIKPHNKTPYELIHGRPPLIDFMIPFGCPVTILNTKDYIDKFDEKAIKGYFCRIFCGTKDNIVLGTKDSLVDTRKKATEVDASQVSYNGGQDTRSEFKGLLQQERQTKHINSTNSFNTLSSPVSTDGPSFVNAASPSPINVAGTPASTNASKEHHFEQFSPFKNAFSLLHVPIVTPIIDTSILVIVTPQKMRVAAKYCTGATTSSSPGHFLEEFADKLTLITFPSRNDDLPFDIESDIREIEYLLNHDPTKEMDSILEESIDECNLADPNNDLVDTIPEMFTDEHTLNCSSPPLYDEFDDALV